MHKVQEIMARKRNTMLVKENRVVLNLYRLEITFV